MADDACIAGAAGLCRPDTDLRRRRDVSHSGKGTEIEKTKGLLLLVAAARRPGRPRLSNPGDRLRSGDFGADLGELLGFRRVGRKLDRGSDDCLGVRYVGDLPRDGLQAAYFSIVGFCSAALTWIVNSGVHTFMRP